MQDRAIVIRMKRKKPGERVTELRGREDAETFTVLQRKAARWTDDNLDALRTARNQNCPRRSTTVRKTIGNRSSLLRTSPGAIRRRRRGPQHKS